LRIELRHDPLPDHRIGCRAWLTFFAEARQSLNEVRTADNPNHLAVGNNRCPFDTMFFEQRGYVTKRCSRSRCNDPSDHDVFNSTGMRFRIFNCESLLALAGKYLQPPRAAIVG